MKTKLTIAAALILLAACQPYTPEAHDRGTGATVAPPTLGPCGRPRCPENPQWPITQPDEPRRGGNCGRGPNPDRGNVPACPEARS